MILSLQTCDPYPVSIFIAGDYNGAEAICREYCDQVGLCVTLTKTLYVYTGGQEPGIIVGLINYPRFPKTSVDILLLAEDLGKKLLQDLNQQSFTIQGLDFCKFYSRRKEDLDALHSSVD